MLNVMPNPSARITNAFVATLPRIAAALMAALTLLALAQPLLQTIDGAVYDLFLGSLHTRAPYPELLLVAPRTKPASAEELARLIRLLDEAEAGRAVVFATEASAVANAEDAASALARQQRELPPAIHEAFSQVEEDVRALFDGLRRGSIPPAAAGDYVGAVVAMTRRSGERLAALAAGKRDANDATLATEAALFGRLFLGVPQTRCDGASGGKGREALALASRRGDAWHPAPCVPDDIAPELASSVAGGGFSGLTPDWDGKVRRLQLIGESDGLYYARPELHALIARLGGPEVEVRRNALVLRGAKLPGGAVRDLFLDLDDEGKVLIPWPADGGAGFRSLDFDEIRRAARLEDELSALLSRMERERLLVGTGGALPSLGRYAEGLRATATPTATPGDTAQAAAWRESRARFFSEAMEYFAVYPEVDLAAALAASTAESAAPEASAALSARTYALFRSHATARALLAELIPLRARLLAALRGSFVFIEVSPPARTPKAPGGATARDSLAAASLAAQILAPPPSGVPLSRALPASAALGLGALCALVTVACAQTRLPLLFGTSALVLALGLLGPAALFHLERLYLSPLPLIAATLAGLAGALAGRGVQRAWRTGMYGTGLVEAAVLVARPTTLAHKEEALDPAAIEAHRRSWLRQAAMIVTAKGGIPEPAPGASLVARFDAAPLAADAATRAIEAAKALYEVGLAVGVRIGLDAGKVVAIRQRPLRRRGGLPGDTLGPAADLAARLSDLCGHYGVGLIASEAIVAYVPAASQTTAQRLGRLRVEGTGREADIYTLTS